MSDLSLQFQIECKDTKPGDNVYVVGNASELGNWKAENSQKLKTNKSKFPLWESEPISFYSKTQLEYKYIIKNNSKNVRWENFQGNRTLDLSSLENGLYYVNDGRYSNRGGQSINKSNELSSQSNTSNKKKVKKVTKTSKPHKDEALNYSISQSEYKPNKKSNNAEIENFINLLVQRNNEKKTWREKLASSCEFISNNFNNEHIISIIAAYLYFVSSGQIKCAESGQHFRPNHSAQQAFNIFKTLYKQIFENSKQINENSFSVVARSILRNLPSFNDQFMVAVPLTRIRDIAHRNDIPQDLKNEIKHNLQNKLHRNAGPEDLVTCEYFINKIKNANYSEAFKHEFYIFYDELKEFFNSSGLETLLHKFKDISKQNSSQTQEVIDCLKSNDLLRKIEIITKFREKCM